MGRPPAEDWEYLYGVFQGIKAEGSKVTLKQFAEDRTVSYTAMSGAFQRIRESRNPGTKQSKNAGIKESIKKPRKKGQRHDWAAYHKRFISGEFRNLADMAAAIGVTPASRFYKQTSGWTEGKQRIEALGHDEAVVNSIKATSADYEGRKLAFIYAFQEILEEAICRKQEIMGMGLTAKDLKDLTSAAISAMQFLDASSPKIKSLEQRQALSGILEGLLSGEANVTQAAYQLTMMDIPLPESIKIILSKTPAPEPDTGESWGLSIEELDRRLELGIALVDHEENVWRVERKETVKQLKESTKEHNSFGPNVIDDIPEK